MSSQLTGYPSYLRLYMFRFQRLRQGTHVVISAAFSARIATFLSRFSIFCWPYRASNKYLAGPIGPAKDPCMQESLAGPHRTSHIFIAGPIGPAKDWKPWQKSSNSGRNLTKIAPNTATCVACLRNFNQAWFYGLLSEVNLKNTCILAWV